MKLYYKVAIFTNANTCFQWRHFSDEIILFFADETLNFLITKINKFNYLTVLI